MKLGSAASTTGKAAAKGTAWTGDVELGEEAVLELELAEVVLMLEEEVEQVVKKAPPSFFW